MTVDAHIQEVLARGTGWILQDHWPTLKVRAPNTGLLVGVYVITYEASADTWARAFIRPGEALDASPPDGGWQSGYFSAEDAAEEAEQMARGAR